MGLLFTGNDDFEQSGPPEWNRSVWDLDTVTIPWRGGINNLDAFLNTHTYLGTEVCPIDDKMWLVNAIPDGHLQFPTVRLVYQGRKGGLLLPYKHELDDAVQSASSKRFASGLFLAAPATIEFYAPTNLLTYYTEAGPGTLTADVPAADPRIINFTLGDTSFVGSGTILSFVNGLFSITVIETFRSTEVIPSRYWKNESRKTKTYVPYLFAFPTGPHLSLYTPGSGYQVGDVLHVVGSSGNATLTVTAVIVLWGTPDQAGVYSWTETSNTFTANENALSAGGGHGSGAKFNVFIVP